MEDAIKTAQLIATKTASNASKISSRLTLQLLEKTRELSGMKNYYDTTEKDIEQELESSVS
jgi:hypothetical protein